jgi:protein-tyrosine phosphatase
MRQPFTESILHHETTSSTRFSLTWGSFAQLIPRPIICWFIPTRNWFLERIFYPTKAPINLCSCFADGPLDEPTFEKAVELADWLHTKWKSGSRSLSRCSMGWNRSGLVMALVLMREGFSSDQAVSLIRSKRGPNALCNSDFVKFLHMHESLNKAS